MVNNNDFASTRPPLRWDAHSCPDLKIGADLSFLIRYKNAGINFVSLNVGFDLNNQNETLHLIEYFHQWINKHSDKYAIINNVKQLLECQNKNKLGIAFDIEGCNILNTDIDMINTLYHLGVRQMLFTYNNNNYYGGGCFDNDAGLTKLGRALVKKFNEVGMVIDCSHVSERTSLEIIELSNQPVVFSHSNPAKLVSHPRNITDKQIFACANTGGVIGINGIGIFLGNNDTSSEKIIDHVEYIIDKVGTQHVGIGLDCIFSENIKECVKQNPDYFPIKLGFENVAVAKPEQFLEIGEILSLRGYSQPDINNILGENFLRIANLVWK
jgi:membrane dipeptidase